MRNNMINSMIWGLVFFLLAQDCIYAAPLQLSGGNGRTILENLTGTGIDDQINATGNNSAIGSSNLTASGAQTNQGLWSWGKIPVGHSVNQTGKLISDPTNSDPTVEVLPRSPF